MNFRIIHHDIRTRDIEAVLAIVAELEARADAMPLERGDGPALTAAIDTIQRSLARRTAVHRRTPEALELIKQARVSLAERLVRRCGDRRLAPREPRR